MNRIVLAVRSLLFQLWMMVTVVPWGIMMVVMSVAVRGEPLFWVAAGWLRIAMFGARWICGIRPRVHGWQHIEQLHAKGQRVILCSKHQSTWETFFFPTVMPRALSYVFKRELIYVPFFGWAMARLDMVHIDRSKGSLAWERVASQGRRFMEKGMWVIMFPEGTRIPRGRAGTYKTGAARLALATDTPIVPIAVNSARCWPKGSLLVRPGVIDVSIGAPISPQGHTAETLMAAVQAWIEAETRRLDPQAYAQAPAPHQDAAAA